MDHWIEYATEGNDRFYQCSCGKQINTGEQADKHLLQVQVERMNADIERYRDVLRRITMLVGDGESFETAQRAAEAGLRGWDPARGQPLSEVVPRRWTPAGVR